MFQLTNQDGQDEEDEEEARIRALVFGQGESSLLRSFGAEGFAGGAATGGGGAAGAERGFYEGALKSHSVRFSTDSDCEQQHY